MAKDRFTVTGTEIKLSANELLAVNGIAKAKGVEWKLVTDCYGDLPGHTFAGSLSFLKTKKVVEAVESKTNPNAEIDEHVKVGKLREEGGMVEDLKDFLPSGVFERVAEVDVLKYNLEIAKNKRTLFEVYQEILTKKARSMTYLRLTPLGTSFVGSAVRVPSAADVAMAKKMAEETSPEGQEKKGKKVKTDSLKSKGPVRGGLIDDETTTVEE